MKNALSMLTTVLRASRSRKAGTPCWSNVAYVGAFEKMPGGCVRRRPSAIRTRPSATVTAPDAPKKPSRIFVTVIKKPTTQPR